MTIIPPQPVYASNQQVPLTQVKNNKKIKNITNKKQNKGNVLKEMQKELKSEGDKIIEKDREVKKKYMEEKLKK